MGFAITDWVAGISGHSGPCGIWSSICQWFALVCQTSRRVRNWTHVLSVLGVHMLDIGCETQGFGKQFNSWYSPCHCVLAFFLRFAMFSAFMSFQNQRQFFAVFLKYAGFSTFLRAFFFYRQGQSSRLDSLIQDFGSLMKQAGMWGSARRRKVA